MADEGYYKQSPPELPLAERISSETALMLINGILKEQLEQALDLLEAMLDVGIDDPGYTMCRKLLARLRPKEKK